MKTSWLAMVTGRAGVTIHNDMLIYAKGGVAFDHNSFAITATAPFSGGIYPTATENRVGWLLGFGTEYMVGSNWSAKLEYNYIDFGSKNLAFAPGTDPTNTTAAFVASSNQQIHLIKAGLNYKIF